MKHYFLSFILILFSIRIIGQSDSGGKISGYMFGDYFYNISRDSEIDSLNNTALSGPKDFNGFQFRRMYLTYDYKISEKFETRFRLEADQSSRTTNDKISVFVKDAYLKWNDIFYGSDLIFGIQPVPAFEISESIWGFRSLEKTILDLRDIVSSRDLAISLRGKFDNNGMINYWIMIGNGGGNIPETDKYKRFYSHLYFNPFKNFHLTIYGDLKIRPSIKNIFNGNSLSSNDITTALFLGYKEKNLFGIGTEGFIQIRENGMITQTREYKNRNAAGLSVFSFYNFSSLFGLIGRYDHFDPATAFKGDSRNFYIFSLRFNPEENISIMPNIIIETYEAIPDETANEASVTARITFYYSY